MLSAASEHPLVATRRDEPPILRGDDDAANLARAALSTDDRPTGHEATGDVIDHEQTFERFLSILTIALQHVVTSLFALAIGGLEGHWAVAIVFVALASLAALAGFASKSLGWKPGGAVLALEILTWLVLA